MKKIAVGVELFDEMIREDNYYVDKTELIYELLSKSTNKVTLFTRPRRFGKTLTMSMMECFFNIRRKSEELFCECEIYRKHPDFCREWMNRYPVLFLTLKDVEGLTFSDAYSMLAAEIAKLCIKHSDLSSRKEIDEADASVFRRLMYKKASKEEIKNALHTIMRMMYTVYERPVILLIDEYDVPLAKAEESRDRDYYRQMLDMLRGIMSISLKTNEYLKFAVITGCMRISKESIFTGVNNFACYSVMSMRFGRYFGFTRDEVLRLLEAFSLSDKMELITQWYDGYIFGNEEVFGPWDVAEYVSELQDDEGAVPGNYWANTSSNAILDDFVTDGRFDVSGKFEVLLNGGVITEEICEELTYDQLSASEKNLWSVLLMTGYLSMADKAPVKKRVRLRIPNREIAELFRDAVVRRFESSLNDENAREFIAALWNGEEEKASSCLTEILWNSISYFDYGEDYYHGMLNGIFTARGYSPDSNDESGLGRLDLKVLDRSKRRVLILEFKRARTMDALDESCNEAIRQIIDRGYHRQLPQGYEQQLVYGIAFYGKVAKVKRMK